MPRSWNKLIPGLIVAAFYACAALPAPASIVIAEYGEAVHENLGPGCLCAWPLPCVAADESAESCDHTHLLLAIELPAEDVQHSGSVPTNSPPCAAHSPQGMSPLPASLSQFGGSGAGAAIASDRSVPQRDVLRAALAPELKLILPCGPVYRWFRPPRVWLYL